MGAGYYVGYTCHRRGGKGPSPTEQPDVPNCPGPVHMWGTGGGLDESRPAPLPPMPLRWGLKYRGLCATTGPVTRRLLQVAPLWSKSPT